MSFLDKLKAIRILKPKTMEFKERLQTKNISKDSKGNPIIMKPTVIVYHHTATGEGTLKGNLNVLLGKTDRQVSAHFLIDTNGDTYKLSEPTFICWHAGPSIWKGKKDVNTFSIGIEVIGPLADGGFTNPQRKSLKELTVHLMKTYGINRDDVTDHKSICIPKGRKNDIADTLWSDEFKSLEDWKAAKLK